jgi:hypothetical protein
MRKLIGGMYETRFRRLDPILSVKHEILRDIMTYLTQTTTLSLLVLLLLLCPPFNTPDIDFAIASGLTLGTK